MPTAATERMKGEPLASSGIPRIANNLAKPQSHKSLTPLVTYI
jgi:hypothetical protein